MKFAYADPPYPGQAKKHYSHDSRCAEVDHKRLVGHLCDEFPDGWALSTNSTSLQYVLSVCPSDVRIGSWVKPFAIFKPNVNPGYCWEPVIFRGGRRRGRDLPTLRDWVSCNITLRKGLSGAKPEDVCRWITDFLNVIEGDEFHDLFPGTGVMKSTLSAKGAYVVEGLLEDLNVKVAA